MRLALFVKLKFQSSTIILSAVIEYSVRDLLSDIDNYADPPSSDMCHIRYMMSALSLASAHLYCVEWGVKLYSLTHALASCEFYH